LPGHSQVSHAISRDRTRLRGSCRGSCSSLQRCPLASCPATAGELPLITVRIIDVFSASAFFHKAADRCRALYCRHRASVNFSIKLSANCQLKRWKRRSISLASCRYCPFGLGAANLTSAICNFPLFSFVSRHLLKLFQKHHISTPRGSTCQ
jgi:hypothetical protein